jgi:hypothetical protein
MWNPFAMVAWLSSVLLPHREKTQFNVQTFSLSSVSSLQSQDITNTGENESLSQWP